MTAIDHAERSTGSRLRNPAVRRRSSSTRRTRWALRYAAGRTAPPGQCSARFRSCPRPCRCAPGHCGRAASSSCSPTGGACLTWATSRLTVGLRLATCVAWVRNRPGTGGLLRASWDPVLVVARGVPDAVDRAAIRNVVVADYPARRSHPYEKPPEVCEHILARVCRRSDLVLDPFAGSGSSLTHRSRPGTTARPTVHAYRDRRRVSPVPSSRDHHHASRGRLISGCRTPFGPCTGAPSRDVSGSWGCGVALGVSLCDSLGCPKLLSCVKHPLAMLQHQDSKENATAAGDTQITIAGNRLGETVRQAVGFRRPA